MSLPEGTRIGPFELLSLLGQGGMGEVYRAWDPRLEREVALKLLPAMLAEGDIRRKRFEREACLVAQISHPSVVQIFDTGIHGGQPYLVMELLEGENLRQHLERGGLPVARSLDWGIQICQGLAAAHDKGIVHRDLKPENVFICGDGRVKLLDFGLAKLRELPSTDTGGAPTDHLTTEADVLLGTVPYFSPEQVTHTPLDGRSDLFAFGILFWEMLTGRRPFSGPSALDVLYAIAHQELPDPPPAEIPEDLAPILYRCLEKQPSRRFHSAMDLAFALEALRPGSSPRVSGARSHALRKPRRWPRRLLLAAPWLAAPGMILIGTALASRPLPTYQRVHLGPTPFETAAFGPDGVSIYAIQGQGRELTLRTPSDDLPRTLSLPDVRLLGVSSTGEIALLHQPRRFYGSFDRGTLCVAPSSGGTHRELQKNAIAAAWDPAGTGLAALTLGDDFIFRLEWPVGRVVHQAKVGGNLRHLRFTPWGIVFLESDGQRCQLRLHHPDGSQSTLQEFPGDPLGDSLTGFAWHPQRGELWYSRVLGSMTEFWALKRSGGTRRVWTLEGRQDLLDIQRDGALLVGAHRLRRGVFVMDARKQTTRDVSIHDGTQPWGLTPDGQHVVLLESPTEEAGTPDDTTYVRAIEGAPPVRLVTGTPYALSPDGRHVQVFPPNPAFRPLDSGTLAAFREAGLDPNQALAPGGAPHVFFQPLGPSRPWVLPLPSTCENLGPAYVLPGDQGVVVTHTHPDGSPQISLASKKGGPLVPLAPKGYRCNFRGLNPISPDGKNLLASDGTTWFRLPIPAGTPQVLRGILHAERPLAWCTDGTILVASPDGPTAVGLFRLDPVSGKRNLVRRLTLPEDGSHQVLRATWAALDGQVAALGFERKSSELYTIRGLK